MHLLDTDTLTRAHAGSADIAERVRQVGEENVAKAFNRLDAQLRRSFPQLPICYSGDSLFACGRSLQLARDSGRGFVFVFKPGRMPAVWQEFQSLLPLCPEKRLERITPEGVRQVYQ